MFFVSATTNKARERLIAGGDTGEKAGKDAKRFCRFPGEFKQKMPGVNTEIEQKGVTFHVQTQDQGTSAHYVESVVYRSGKVISSRRTYYTSFLNSPSLQDKIDEIITEQHDSLLTEIAAGRFDHL